MGGGADAHDWYVRVSIVSNPDKLDLEVSNKIVSVCWYMQHISIFLFPLPLLFPPPSSPVSLPMAIPFFQVQYLTLQPEGLNTKLCFYSKEHWYTFAEWYSQHRREKSNKHTPITQHCVIYIAIVLHDR